MSNKMNSPIIFCHYGNTGYLAYTLQAAKLCNPGKEIYMLGDASNRWLGKKYGIRHVCFSELDTGTEIETFERVFVPLQGIEHARKHGDDAWLRFVFKRWFYVYNFMRSQGIDSFWHFDSDTMILTDLGVYEASLATYDCTEQCNGDCLNGFVPDVDVLRRYLLKINALYQDSAYVAEQRNEFAARHKDFAFTEMRAYREFRDDEKINSIHLQKSIPGGIFDDCICQPHGMEMEKMPTGRHLKKLYFGKQGTFFFRCLSDGGFVQVLTLNLSWVPDYIFLTVWLHLKRRPSVGKQMPTLGEKIGLRYKWWEYGKRQWPYVRYLLVRYILRRPYE